MSRYEIILSVINENKIFQKLNEIKNNSFYSLIGAFHFVCMPSFWAKREVMKDSTLMYFHGYEDIYSQVVEVFGVDWRLS